jgi:hypothetical protein
MKRNCEAGISYNDVMTIFVMSVHGRFHNNNNNNNNNTIIVWSVKF